MTSTSVNLETAKVYRLDNGMRIALEKLPHLRSATAGVWVKSGSGNEQPHESGLAHFLEHLFFKGTTKRSTHELMEAVESRGGHLNAFTSREYTCLYVKMLDKDIHVGVDVLADLVKNSLFADLEKERNVILEEIASIEDMPDEYVHDLIALHHWPDHALGRPISGTEESVSKLTLQDVRQFFEAWYTPEEMVFAIAGNFDEEAIFRQLREEFEPLEPRKTPAREGAPDTRPSVYHVERDIAQAHLCLAFPAPTVLDDQRFACTLASSVLGGGSTSWLFEKIREEEGLAYAIYTFDSFHEQAGMFGIYSATAEETLQQTLDLTYASLRRLRDEGVEPAELESNRQQIEGNMLMALESTSSRMGRMAKCLLHYDRVLGVDEILARFDAVTPEDVQRYARENFRPDLCSLTVLGPINGAAIRDIQL